MRNVIVLHCEKDILFKILQTIMSYTRRKNKRTNTEGNEGSISIITIDNSLLFPRET